MTEDWRESAACRGADPNLFIPERDDTSGRNTRYPDQVKAMCAACPVRQECLDYALVLGGQLAGYWGGTTPRQRRTMHANAGRQQALERHQTAVRVAAAIAAGAHVADLADAYGVTPRTVKRYAAAGR